MTVNKRWVKQKKFLPCVVVLNNATFLTSEKVSNLNVIIIELLYFLKTSAGQKYPCSGNNWDHAYVMIFSIIVVISLEISRDKAIL